MSNISIHTTCKKIPADLYTPVGIYLRMRDKFRDTILLESTDSHAGENSRSVIAINAIAGIEIIDFDNAEYKYPGQKPEQLTISKREKLPDILGSFLESFEAEKPEEKAALIAQGLFGYTSYDAVQFFEKISFSEKKKEAIESFPLMRYRLYQYIIIIDHFKDEIYLCENHVAGVEGSITGVEDILKVRMFLFFLSAYAAVKHPIWKMNHTGLWYKRALIPVSGAMFFR